MTVMNDQYAHFTERGELEVPNLIGSLSILYNSTSSDRFPRLNLAIGETWVSKIALKYFEEIDPEIIKENLGIALESDIMNQMPQGVGIDFSKIFQIDFCSESIDRCTSLQEVVDFYISDNKTMGLFPLTEERRRESRNLGRIIRDGTNSYDTEYKGKLLKIFPKIDVADQMMADDTGAMYLFK